MTYFIVFPVKHNFKKDFASIMANYSNQSTLKTQINQNLNNG